jgi:hypothetical protein
MEYRLTKEMLIAQLAQWDSFLKREIHLIACGGTAMTLLGVKASTRDVDFIVPKQQEYEYLIKLLKDLGYKNVRGSGWARDHEAFIFDLFAGKRVHTTDLLNDPLESANHTLIKEFAHIYLGVLNDYDLIVSKLFRGDRVDFEDCVSLMKARKDVVDMDKLKNYFFEMLSYHPVGKNRVQGNWDSFQKMLSEAK